MGQVIGTVNVQVNRQQGATVRSLNYGIRSLKGSTDLTLAGAATGDAIIYDANTNSFSVAPVTGAIVSDIDGGIF